MRQHNDEKDMVLIKHYIEFFPHVLFASKDDMEAYVSSLDSKPPLNQVEDGGDPPESTDPREHMYILKNLVGRNPATAAFVAIRGSNLNEKVVAKFVVLTDEKQTSYARSELHCLAACTHFGIVKHYDDFQTKDKVLLIMEYGSGGDLNKQIKQRLQEKLPFKEHEVGLLFYQIVLALDEVHSRRMMHRDLKSANIFLMPTGIIKLGDFGFSKQYNDSVSLDVGSSFCGTPYYLAPELWERKCYSKKADMWSLGVILYELLTLQRPFKGPSQRAIMQQVLYNRYDPFSCPVSSSMKYFLDLLLSKNPSERPTTQQLLQTDFMKYVGNLFEEIVTNSAAIKPQDKKEIIRHLIENRRKISLQRTIRSGSASADVVHEGYLFKYSSDFKWKRRYFSIKNGMLQTSITDKPESDPTPPKATRLEAISDVFPVPEVYCRSHPNQLVIQFTNGQKVIAMGSSEEDRDTWLAKIHLACGM